jgi:hypothetical protein
VMYWGGMVTVACTIIEMRSDSQTVNQNSGAHKMKRPGRFYLRDARALVSRKIQSFATEFSPSFAVIWIDKQYWKNATDIEIIVCLKAPKSSD